MSICSKVIDGNDTCIIKKPILVKVRNKYYLSLKTIPNLLYETIYPKI